MQLVAMYQAGDRSALDKLIRRYQDRLPRLVRSKLGARLRQRVDSEGIVQEVSLAIFRDVDRIRATSDGSIMFWVATVIENRIRAAYAAMTAQCRDADRSIPLAELVRADPELRDFTGLIHDDVTPSRVAQANEAAEALDLAVAALPDLEREVFLMRMYAGLSWDETVDWLAKAAAFQKRVGGKADVERARRILESAHDRLRVQLARHFDDKP